MCVSFHSKVLYMSSLWLSTHALFSRYGEIIHVELIRDQKTGKSKGFAFLQYEDQRSTVLAVDNLNGATVSCVDKQKKRSRLMEF